MGRKLPKKSGYRRSNQNNAIKGKFPDCIGKFPECKNYSPEMDLESRPECKSCPFNK
jgi:hypothetical protein